MGITASAQLPDSRDTLSKHGKSFHFASRFLGERHAVRAARLYAFCRHIDDMIDLAASETAAGRLLDLIELELAGRAALSEQTRDFLELARETGMGLSPIYTLISGVRSDLGVVALKTQNDLLRYAYQVAGVVGLMMCDVLDVRAPEARPFAIDLGIGMQLTNIARDVAEDAQRGRRYLPESWIGRVSPDQLLHPSPQMKVSLQHAERKLLELAEDYYASAECGMGHLPRGARFAVLVAGRVYRQIGCKIASQGFTTWNGRAHVSSIEKIAIAFRAAGAFVVSRQLHARSHAHDSQLHHALAELKVSQHTELVS